MAFFSARLLPLIAALALGFGSSARADDMPALNIPASTESHPGKFQWADLFADDAAKAAEFYTGAFGWTSTEVAAKNDRRVYLLKNGAETIASVVQRSAQRKGTAPARWIGYAATNDLASTLTAVVSAGGTVVAKARTVPDRGDQAIVTDAQGAVLGLIRSSSGDIPDYQPQPGDLVWAQLFTATPKNAAPFYEKIFGCQSVVDTDHDDGQHLLLATGEIARAGIAPSPPWEDDKPDWLIFFCVHDVDDVTKKATQLGGSVVVEPRNSTHGGRVAVIVDPQGGLVGLLEAEAAKQLKEAP